MSENQNVREQGQDTGESKIPQEQIIENISHQQVNEPSRIADINPETEKSPTEEMEVHHHPNVEKKNFKEYLLEFIMIFLAVTLGFFAENIREHYVEHKRAHQYASLLIQDINKNTLQVQQELERRKIMELSFDTLKNLLLNNRIDSNFQIVKHVVLLSETLPLPITTATFSQMQNSGSLRYIQDPELTGLLTDYFNTLIPLTQTDIEQEFQINRDNNQKFIQQHFNLLQVDTSDNVLTAYPDIYDWNKRVAVQMFNAMVNTSIWNQWIMEKDLLPIKEQGKLLVTHLQKEYNLH
jgi:hypothetical protein